MRSNVGNMYLGIYMHFDISIRITRIDIEFKKNTQILIYLIQLQCLFINAQFISLILINSKFNNYNKDIILFPSISFFLFL